MGERDWPTPSLRVAATLAILLAAILQGTASAQKQDPARDAYLDETARQLVLGLKAARDTACLSIDTYTALIRERLGLEWPSPRRNRPWAHGERTARVRWSRDEPAVVHVLAARFRVALVDPEDSEFFTGLRTERFAADPLGDPFTFGFTVFAPSTEAEITTRSPLGPAAERYYQFRSGDTIAVRLSDGSTLRGGRRHGDPSLPQHAPRLRDHVDRRGVFRARARRLPAGQTGRPRDDLAAPERRALESGDCISTSAPLIPPAAQAQLTQLPTDPASSTGWSTGRSTARFPAFGWTSRRWSRSTDSGRCATGCPAA